MSAEVEDPVQGSVSVDDSLGVDATSLIVRELHRNRGDQIQLGPPILHSEVEMRLEELFLLGKVYSYFEELWSECEWADAVFDSQVSPPVLRLRQSEWGIRSTISEYRIHSVRTEQKPDHLVLRPRKMRSGQRFRYLALQSGEPARRPRVPTHPLPPIQRYYALPGGFIRQALQF
jgi:hypothetical protein